MLKNNNCKCDTYDTYDKNHTKIRTVRINFESKIQYQKLLQAKLEFTRR